MRLYKHFVEWAHFTNTDDYRRYRQEEGDLLLVAAGDASAVASAVIESLQPWLPGNHGLPDKARALRERLVRALSEAVVSQVRARFSIPEGISVLWNGERYWAEKWVLFERQDVFDESFRRELQILAIRAQEDRRIQKNFLSFVRLLADGLSRGFQPVATNKILKLVQDQELMTVLWRGATSRPLQPRVAGSLVDERITLVNAMDNEDALPIPEWLRATTAQDPAD